MRPEEKPCDGGVPLGRVARTLKTGSAYLIPTRKVNASPGTGRRAESAVAFRIHLSQDKDNFGDFSSSAPRSALSCVCCIHLASNDFSV